jgi:hypothetical protein
MGGNAQKNKRDICMKITNDDIKKMKNGDRQYSVVRVDPSINAPAVPGLGPTANGGAQYFSDSGGINAPLGTSFGNPIGLMNPYLTLNYIIRSGPPII